MRELLVALVPANEQTISDRDLRYITSSVDSLDIALLSSDKDGYSRTRASCTVRERSCVTKRPFSESSLLENAFGNPPQLLSALIPDSLSSRSYPINSKPSGTCVALGCMSGLREIRFSEICISLRTRRPRTSCSSVGNRASSMTSPE
jgi:hypothetical protein